MNQDLDRPFQSIEGAQDYLRLLIDAVNESRSDLGKDLNAGDQKEGARSQDALRLVRYKLDHLEKHIKASCRILNDLRTLRRLLLKEREQRPDDWKNQEQPADPMVW